MKILIALLFLCACGKSGGSIAFVQGFTTTEMDAAVADFEDDFNVAVNFEVVYVDEFSQPHGQAQAYCYTGGTKRVEVLSEVEHNSEAYMKGIVYHELGHCALGLRHYDVDMDIMNTRPEMGQMAPTINFFIEKMKDRVL